ncbi:MAG: glycosyltransferase family 2 protein [Gemmatimonadota bacterium]|nr:glycosyltransferase family 2 protein [Gemmatimonadota bacterium]
MLHICIPTYNEGPTVGVLLWRIRKVFQDYSREYEVVVYDDGSTDGTSATLEPYSKVLPLTILRGETRQGFGHALDALAADVSRRTRYPRRDAMVLMQADFTDQPEALPDLVKRFEGGADIVTTERDLGAMPAAVRRLVKVAPWMVKPFVSAGAVADPFGSFRLFRISLLRDYAKASPAAPLVTSDGWAATLEMFVKLSPFARKIETVSVAPRYDLRPRGTRVRPFADAMGLYRAGRAARSWRHAVGV